MVELQMDLANESLDFHGKTWVGSIHFRLYNLQTVQKKAECNWNDFSRLNVSTMYNVRQWERFQFLMDYEHKQVFFTPDQLGYFLGPKVLFFFSTRRFCSRLFQMRWSFRLPTRLKTISSPRSRSPKCFHFRFFLSIASRAPDYISAGPWRYWRASDAFCCGGFFSFKFSHKSKWPPV